MPLRYDLPRVDGCLSQGEILRDLAEYIPAVPTAESPENTSVPFEMVSHPVSVVVTADCDLAQDFKVRYHGECQSAAPDPGDPKMLPCVWLVDAFTREQLRVRFDKDLWKHIERNHDVRYHRLAAAAVRDRSDEPLPGLYLDFKRVFALPTRWLYEALRHQNSLRVAVVPPIWIHGLIQRFHAYSGRIGLPDE